MPKTTNKKIPKRKIKNVKNNQDNIKRTLTKTKSVIEISYFKCNYVGKTVDGIVTVRKEG
jgi:hypothetical protein